MVGRFVGEAEQKLRDIFAQARQSAPAVIFVDELDALCPTRDSASDELSRRLVASMLTLLDSLDGLQVVV